MEYPGVEGAHHFDMMNHSLLPMRAFCTPCRWVGRYHRIHNLPLYRNFGTLRCGCSLVSCGCCDGNISLGFNELKSSDSNHSLKLLSSACSPLSCESVRNTNGKKLDESQVEKGWGMLRLFGQCKAVSVEQNPHPPTGPSRRS